MNVFNAMSVFITVAELNSFAAAARKLDLSTTSVSRLIQDFEAWIGAPLLVRTTRKLALTETGEQQLESCRRIVADTQNLRLHAKNTIDEALGQLRVTAPPFIARRLLAKILPEFLLAYPKVNLELVAIGGYIVQKRFSRLGEFSRKQWRNCRSPGARWSRYYLPAGFFR